MPFQALIKLYLVLTFHHICSANIRKRETDDAKLASKRFIFDANHKFTGWASWEHYAACSTLCVSGYEQQTKECCDTGDNRLCYNIPWDNLRSHIGTCPVDGHFGSWGSWSPCSTTCGNGIKYRTRYCEFDINAPRGKNCTGDFIESQPCSQRSCPVDGIWNTWSRWSACSASCGGGSMDRHRDCFFAPHVPQGDYCAGKSKQSQNCNSDLCPGRCNRGVDMKMCPVDGVWTMWSAWTTCSATCGSGTMSRHRECHFQPHVPQGAPCRGTAVQSQSCNDISCPAPNPRSCYQCLGPPVICEKLNAPQVCPLDKPFCINTLNNFRNASRSVEMRCGTRDECQRGWYDTYRNDDKCTKFSQDFIYTNDFSCEFCCNTDNCNEKVNPDTKWQP